MRFNRKAYPCILRWLVLAATISSTLGGCLLLAGCVDDPATKGVTLPVATLTEVVSVPAFTPTAAFTATATRTATPTTSPTFTVTSSPTGLQATENAPTVPPAPQATASPTLTPTVAPGVRLEAGRQHQANGEYAQAILAYLAVLEDGPPLDEARQAQYYLAEVYLLDQQYVTATAALQDFIATYPTDGLLPNATLMAARAYHGAGRCAEAIPYYQDYLNLTSGSGQAVQAVLTDKVNEWIGDCYAADEDMKQAMAAYQRSLNATTDRSTQTTLREKIATLSLAMQDYDAAVAQYDAALALASTDDYRAKVEYLAGQALAAAGDTEAAQARYRRAVDRYPKAAYAYLSLVELVDAGAQVDDFQRGLVDYNAGAAYPDAYGAAVRALGRYLEAQPAPPKADEALYYQALAQRALGDTSVALATLDRLITDYPQSKLLSRAWLEKGATQALMGNSDQALVTYQELAARFPGSELAPQALWRAARLLEAEGNLAEAARLYKEVQARFPAYADADAALWRAGLNAYLDGDRATAIGNWKALLADYPKSASRSTALYWLGKLDTQSGSALGGAYWDQLVAEDPDGYYALRVGQIRAGEPPASTQIKSAALEPPIWDPVPAERAVLAWLSDWTRLPTDTALLALPGTQPTRRALARGQALEAIGLRREALQAFDGVRAAAWSDPVALAQLAFFFRGEGFYGLAARCALRLVGLWPEGTIDDAPIALQHLAYPLNYADLISAEAGANGLDPLLLAALIRQESLFEPAAQSSAGARGLGQVMPATGEGIARNLGMDDFVLDDLYRPVVSIKFGAYYLAIQLKRFHDETILALAAYNGGPGNALHWQEAAGDDPDLFVEVITASESRRYLQRVYEQYFFYQKLYGLAAKGS